MLTLHIASTNQLDGTANLIAAAPDLLEALNKSLEVILLLASRQRLDGVTLQTISNTIEAARAAIAKAEQR